MITDDEIDDAVTAAQSMVAPQQAPTEIIRRAPLRLVTESASRPIVDLAPKQTRWQRCKAWLLALLEPPNNPTYRAIPCDPVDPYLLRATLCLMGAMVAVFVILLLVLAARTHG